MYICRTGADSCIGNLGTCQWYIIFQERKFLVAVINTFLLVSISCIIVINTTKIKNIN